MIKKILSLALLFMFLFPTIIAGAVSDTTSAMVSPATPAARATSHFSLPGDIPLPPGADPQLPAPLSPGAVSLIGHFGGATGAVAVQDKLVYLGIGPRLFILDLNNPAVPESLGQTAPLPGILIDITIADGYLYAVDVEGNLLIMDLSDPRAPLPTSFFNTGAPQQSLAAGGGYVYLVGSSGLMVVNATNPAAPVPGANPGGGGGWGVTIDGGRLYAAQAGGVRIYDLVDPANPLARGFAATTGGAFGVAAAGDYAYVADGPSGMRVINVADPDAPFEAGFADTTGHSEDVAVENGYAYLADGGVGLHIYNLTDPAAPNERGLVDTFGWARRVAVEDAIAYVGDVEGGLRIIDATSPNLPVETGALQTPMWARSVAPSGLWGAAAFRYGGLGIFDISNPSQPFFVTRRLLTNFANDVEIANGIAFIADGDGGLQVFDVSQPGAPLPLTSLPTPGWAARLEVVTETVYLADSEGGLRIFDAATPSQPAEIGALLFPDPNNPGSYASANGVTRAGGLAYVAAGNLGLRVVDVSNPAQPQEVGQLETPGIAWDVAPAGRYVALAAGPAGLRVIDVSNPAAPQEAGFVDTPGEANAVVVFGNYAYVADGNNGLRVVDLSNPAAPVEIDAYDSADYASGVAVQNGLVYLASGAGGIYILEAPFAAHALHLPLLTRAALTYSISGRVTTGNGLPLAGVKISAGAYNVVTDVQGAYRFNSLPPGAYTLTPVLEDYLFTPAARTVSLPPNASGQDFIAEVDQSPQCTDILINGGFEDNTGWELVPTAYKAVYTTEQAHSGARSLRAGISNPSKNTFSYSSGRQRIRLPANATDVIFSTWLYAYSTEALSAQAEAPTGLGGRAESLMQAFLNPFTRTLSQQAGDAQYVLILDANDNRIATLLWQRDDSRRWQQYAWNLQDYAGQTIQIQFGAYNDGTGGVTALYADDAMVQVCTPAAR